MVNQSQRSFYLVKGLLAICFLNFFIKCYVTNVTNVSQSSLRAMSSGKKLSNFVQERQKQLDRGSIKNCDQENFHSYASFHNIGRNSDQGKFLIYHVLDEDTVGLGCRMSAALYALTLAMHMRRILILSGIEFKYIYSKYINFTDDDLALLSHTLLKEAQMWKLVSKNNRTYVKFGVTQGNYEEELYDLFYSDSLAQVDVLYTNMLASHRHFDILMARDLNFRGKVLKVFGHDGAKFVKENRALASQSRYKLVPEYPTVWRRLWGCAHWFLLNNFHRDLEEEIYGPFLNTSKPCEKLVSIHFRGGDVSFYEHLSRRERKYDKDTEFMIDRWAKRVRTPLGALKLYFFYAKQVRNLWNEVNVCYFIASDNKSIFSIAREKLGDTVFETTGSPTHSSLIKSEKGLIKALADYVLLGIGDGLVHGMSTLSESAVERNYGQNIEVKCRSPQKTLWSEVRSWYCVRKGEHLDARAMKAIKFIRKTKPGVLSGSMSS